MLDMYTSYGEINWNEINKIYPVCLFYCYKNNTYVLIYNEFRFNSLLLISLMLKNIGKAFEPTLKTKVLT